MFMPMNSMMGGFGGTEFGNAGGGSMQPMGGAGGLFSQGMPNGFMGGQKPQEKLPSSFYGPIGRGQYPQMSLSQNMQANQGLFGMPNHSGQRI